MRSRLLRLAVFQCVLGTLTLGSLSVVAAQEPDYTVDIGGSFLRRAIEGAVQDMLETMPGVGWDSGDRVETQANGEIDVVVNLLIDTDVFLAARNVSIPDVPDVIEVEVDFRLSITCHAPVPELWINVDDVDVSIGLTLPADILLGPIGPILAAVGDAFLSDVGPNAEAKIDKMLREDFRLGPIESCPSIVLHDDCSYTFEFGGPNSCTNGAEKRLSCGIGQIFYVCVNGKWVWKDMTCH